MIRSLQRFSKWVAPQSYQQTRKPLARALSLDPKVYHDPEYYNVEQNQLWKKHWFAAEHVQAFQKPGDIKVVDVGDQSYLLTCDRNLQIRAFHNVCRHRGAKLCIESGNKKRLNCPYHWWSYNLKGDLIAAPWFEREDFDRSQYGLLPVRADVYGGLVWLCADPEAPSLMDQMQGFPNEFAYYPFQDLEIRGQKDYTVNCDWKVLAENFMEWYHVGPIHPNLAKFSTPETHIPNQGPGKYMSFVTSPLANSGSVTDLDQFHMTPGHEELAKHAPKKFNASDTAYFYHLFPNVSVTIYPHSVYTLIMLPHSSGKANEKLTLLQHPACRLESDDDEKYQNKMEQLLDFVCEVNDEDIEICERLDKGMRQSAYKGGMFSTDMEFTIYRFQNLLADVMTNEPPRVFPEEMFDYDSFRAASEAIEVPKGHAEIRSEYVPVHETSPIPMMASKAEK